MLSTRICRGRPAGSPSASLLGVLVLCRLRSLADDLPPFWRPMAKGRGSSSDNDNGSPRSLLGRRCFPSSLLGCCPGWSGWPGGSEDGVLGASLPLPSPAFLLSSWFGTSGIGALLGAGAWPSPCWPSVLCCICICICNCCSCCGVSCCICSNCCRCCCNCCCKSCCCCICCCNCCCCSCSISISSSGTFGWKTGIICDSGVSDRSAVTGSSSPYI